MRTPTITQRFNPVRGIEWVIVAISFISAGYIFSPLFRESVAANGATPFVSALSNPAFLYLYAFGLLATALILMWGIVTDKPGYRSVGLFLQFLLRLFNVITTVLAAGLFPLTWLSSAALVFIVLVLWINARLDVKVYASP